MSTTHDGTTALPIGTESAWVVYDVVLAELVGEDADRPLWALEIAKGIEAGDVSMTPTEGRRLQECLREYLAGDVPDRDVDPAERVLAVLDARLEDAPGRGA